MLYSTGRFLQLVGMSLLIGSIMLDRGLGPSPVAFGVGVGAFIVGWGLTRRRR
jgi:hypothetical protein